MSSYVKTLQIFKTPQSLSVNVLRPISGLRELQLLSQNNLFFLCSR